MIKINREIESEKIKKAKDVLAEEKSKRKGNFSWNEYIKIEPLNDSEDVKETVDLLNKVYIGSTAMKKLEATNIRKELRSELQKFINAINEYDEAEGMDKEDAALLIVRELKCNSPFAAFKRWVIRDNCDKLSKFMCKW